ncbi:nuclear transport factor 2 family protein [Lysobacter koreensis]|uniref:Nuclear transport factor 2 family protein n=1 Tax=Lysobacter koreensis TaxID=266122 RepID=A0ABW2YI99_9GAMM
MLLAVGCGRTSPKQRLRDSLDGLKASLEARDVAGMQQWLADDFIGPEGLDRTGAKRIAQGVFLRHGDIGVNVGPLDVSLRPRHATVSFSAALTGGSGGMLPETAQLYDVETGWRLDDGEWRLTSARWTPRL